MNWEELTEHLTLYQRKLIPISGNGSCFIESVRTYLANDHLIDIPSQTVENSIFEELYDNVGQYSEFHEGTNRKILQDADQLFKDPLLIYATDIVDVIVCAAANALQTNFAIFQNIGGKAVIIYTNCSKIATNRTIYLKFNYHPGKSGNNHCTAMVEDTGVKPTPAVK